ncbi:hypothetical protein [Geoalkalibacter subterraneus]|uniref:Uncharacterized protein n=1 Tax=Geoalkalibacter subterraneus TaxID=483547 RepID=A0A0B5FXC9_9BACT|nr:hypothetical protein [Geoalkalibacter subterraneus]AJF08246.1 hypothetical protein GSUB_17325 [Geoalkalibacter subterraneus]
MRENCCYFDSVAESMPTLDFVDSLLDGISDNNALQVLGKVVIEKTEGVFWLTHLGPALRRSKLSRHEVIAEICEVYFASIKSGEEQILRQRLLDGKPIPAQAFFDHPNLVKEFSR